MQNIFDYLKANHIQYFYFLRIPIGKKNANGIYEFKSSTGGNVVHFNGEWVYFKSLWFRHFGNGAKNSW